MNNISDVVDVSSTADQVDRQQVSRGITRISEVQTCRGPSVCTKMLLNGKKDFKDPPFTADFIIMSFRESEGGGGSLGPQAAPETGLLTSQTLMDSCWKRRRWSNLLRDVLLPSKPKWADVHHEMNEIRVFFMFHCNNKFMRFKNHCILFSFMSNTHPVVCFDAFISFYYHYVWPFKEFLQYFIYQ